MNIYGNFTNLDGIEHAMQWYWFLYKTGRGIQEISLIVQESLANPIVFFLENVSIRSFAPLRPGKRHKNIFMVGGPFLGFIVRL